MSIVRTRRGVRGAGTLEWLGCLVVAAACVGAILQLAPSRARDLAGHLDCLVERVAGTAAPDATCAARAPAPRSPGAPRPRHDHGPTAMEHSTRAERLAVRLDDANVPAGSAAEGLGGWRLCSDAIDDAGTVICQARDEHLWRCEATGCVTPVFDHPSSELPLAAMTCSALPDGRRDERLCRVPAGREALLMRCSTSRVAPGVRLDAGMAVCALERRNPDRPLLDPRDAAWCNPLGPPEAVSQDGPWWAQRWKADWACASRDGEVYRCASETPAVAHPPSGELSTLWFVFIHGLYAPDQVPVLGPGTLPMRCVGQDFPAPLLRCASSLARVDGVLQAVRCTVPGLSGHPERLILCGGPLRSASGEPARPEGCRVDRSVRPEDVPARCQQPGWSGRRLQASGVPHDVKAVLGQHAAFLAAIALCAHFFEFVDYTPSTQPSTGVEVDAQGQILEEGVGSSTDSTLDTALHVAAEAHEWLAAHPPAPLPHPPAAVPLPILTLVPSPPPGVHAPLSFTPGEAGAPGEVTMSLSLAAIDEAHEVAQTLAWLHANQAQLDPVLAVTLAEGAMGAAILITGPDDENDHGLPGAVNEAVVQIEHHLAAIGSPFVWDTTALMQSLISGAWLHGVDPSDREQVTVAMIDAFVAAARAQLEHHQSHPLLRSAESRNRFLDEVRTVVGDAMDER